MQDASAHQSQCQRQRGSSGGAAQDQFADVCDVQLIRSQGCESGVTSVPHKKASAHALECAWRNVHAGNANIANISCDAGSGFAAHTGTGMFFFFFFSFFRANCGARIKSPQGRCGRFAGCPPANFFSCESGPLSQLGDRLTAYRVLQCCSCACTRAHARSGKQLEPAGAASKSHSISWSSDGSLGPCDGQLEERAGGAGHPGGLGFR